MSFSSIASMLSAAQESGQPLYAVIRDADCQENGYDAAASYRQIAALWTAMQQSSRQYCASDRSNSGLIGGDAARFRAAAEAGRLLGGTYFQRVTEEALKVAECNACMKRIVAAPTAQQCADAYAIALGNLLGLVCDPVAGLVEVPCVKRNVIGAVNAVSAANMAVAGITSRIPVDEVIDAMGEVGDALPASLRETGLGGLAATPTGRQAAERIARAEH